MRRLACALLAGWVAASCGAEPRTLDVGCAASLRAPVEAVAAAFERDHGVAVRVSAAGSAEIARQVSAGAPIDVFISAHPRWVEELRQAPLRTLAVAGNALVLATRDGGETGTVAVGTALPAAIASGRVAMGDPGHVPVGQYGREALEALGWWPDVEPVLVPASSASAAARLLRIGEVDALIGYATDVRGMDGVIARPLDPALHGRIEIVAADLGTDPAGPAFLDALLGAEELLAEHGFLPAESAR